jgi:hypothetical protein
MENPFLSPPAERLADWKVFRRRIADSDLTTKLDAVARYWSHAPIGAVAYDPDDASHWLTPWEQLHHNQWCRSSVAIGMESTLRLAGVAPERLALRLISDETSGYLLVLMVDDTYALNYDWGSVRSAPLRGHTVIREWQFAERGYCQSGK